MIWAANGEQEEPTALERERAMGFMENTTQAGPPITESDRRRLLGSTNDMHALTSWSAALSASSSSSSRIDSSCGPPPAGGRA